jgi:hypothetical protein
MSEELERTWKKMVESQLLQTSAGDGCAKSRKSSVYVYVPQESKWVRSEEKTKHNRSNQTAW